MILKTYKTPKIKQKIQFLQSENQQLVLAPVGDFHFGTEHFPKERFKNHFKWWMDRGAIFLGMGDYLDFAPYSQRQLLAPMREETRVEIAITVTHNIEKLAAILEFTKGRWIGLLEGGHRFDFLDGTSSDQLICKYLGCDFLGTSAYITVDFKEVPKGHPEVRTIIYAHHGNTTTRTLGGQLLRVEELFKWLPGVDIYLMAHSHAKIIGTLDVQCVTPPPEEILYHKTKIAARTGGWLLQYVAKKPLPLDAPAFKSRGTYVEQRLYSPTALGGLGFGIGYSKIEGSKYYRPTIHCSL